MYDLQGICQVFHICIKMTGKKIVVLCKHVVQLNNTELLEKAVFSTQSCNLIGASWLLKEKKSPLEQVTIQNEIWEQAIVEDSWERTVNSN